MPDSSTIMLALKQVQGFQYLFSLALCPCIKIPKQVRDDSKNLSPSDRVFTNLITSLANFNVRSSKSYCFEFCILVI
jgi:hypothetical protein